MILLDRLNPTIIYSIDDHNRNTLNTFTQYCRVFALTQLAQQQTHSLPLSRIEFSDAPMYSSSKETVTGLLNKNKMSPLVRSPFVSISGFDDRFQSAAELNDTVRQEIDVEGAFIPVYEYQNVLYQDLKLNAYVLDFYKHGQYRTILEDNMLRSGYAWEKLKEWSLDLRTIKTAFEQSGCDKEKDIIYRTFAYLSEKYDEKFTKIRGRE